MKAIVQTGYGEPEAVLHLASLEKPTPGPDEVLLRVRATSINTPDWLLTIGTPYVLRLLFGLTTPRIPVGGSDVAGIVEAVGANVRDLQPGDEVFGSVWKDAPAKHGAFAEYTVAPAAQLFAKPASLSFEEAAASVMSGLTAMLALRVGNVRAGTKLLINGASGGVGMFAVQFAKKLGAHVTAVCSAKNESFVRSLGADDVIDYNSEDFTLRTKQYDVLLDNVMNQSPSRSMQVLVPGGVFVPNSVGASDGIFGGISRVLWSALLGLFYGEVRTVTCVVNRENLAALAALLEDRQVRVVLEHTYALEAVPQAIRHMRSHRAKGKLAISV